MGRTKPRFRDATEARHAYRTAPEPILDQLAGTWRIEFCGNDHWMDVLPKVLRLLGLHKLFGLRIDGATTWHLVGKPKRLEEVKPLSVEVAESMVDGRRTARMTTVPGNGRLWDLFASEVRRLDDDTLVGVDLVGWDRWVVPMPFVLHRHDG